MVLLICKGCLDEGHNIIVRAARQNARDKQANLQIENARELARAEVATTQMLIQMAAENVASVETDMRSE